MDMSQHTYPYSQGAADVTGSFLQMWKQTQRGSHLWEAGCSPGRGQELYRER